MTEAWNRRKNYKAKRKQNWWYSCHARQWWGTEVACASFRYTDGGKAKMQAWVDEYLEADWTVSVKLVRGER